MTHRNRKKLVISFFEQCFFLKQADFKQVYTKWSINRFQCCGSRMIIFTGSDQPFRKLSVSISNLQPVL
jgi:hypothetical protein